ncbi:SMP-30/gluconolactonase/LRE family protein [soil metagenome]
MSGLASPTTEVLGDSRDIVGESPVWSVAEQALYWVDIEGRQIRRYDWTSHRLSSWTAPERVGCIALRQGGGLIAAMETGVSSVDLPAGAEAPTFTPIVTAHHSAPCMRFNDGRCDRQGRFWVGSMCMDMNLASASGALFRLTADEIATGNDSSVVMNQPVIDRLIVPNGLGFSPDSRVMYLSDSHPSVQTIWRFDFDADSGTASNRSVFVDMNSYPGRPDGAAVDEDGCYWICGNDAGMVHRFTPQGVLDRSVSLPFSKPAMCAFGGPHLDTLFVTSIQPARPAATHPDEASVAGAVLMLDIGTRGLAEPQFG